MDLSQVIYSTTKASTNATSTGTKPWSNPTNIYTDNATSASIGFSMGGELGDPLNFDTFNFDIPDFAVIDGIVLTVDGSNLGCYGDLVISGGTSKDVDDLSGDYGGVDDLWGTTWTPADINDDSFGGSITVNDVSGGDGVADVDYLEITVYWHYDNIVDPADVPKRYKYKVYRNSNYLGDLPEVMSSFGYAQEINSVGASIVVDCGVSFDTSYLSNDRLVTEAGEPITTESGEYLYTEKAENPIITGDSDVTRLFQNGNRVLIYEYSYYYPNGKLMFSGFINRIETVIGVGEDKISVTIYSDGTDLDNYIARGSPFSYTTDVTQSSQNGFVTVKDFSGAGWTRYGQTWITGGSVTNMGKLTLKLKGNATVTVTVAEGPNQDILGSVTKSVNVGTATNIEFAFANLITLSSSTSYFFYISVGSGQSINVYRSNANPYANGSVYVSNYGGGGGGAFYVDGTSDLYFITASGTPTTSATYTSKDPTTEVLAPVVDDYNIRGGLITYEDANIEATGLSITMFFNTNTILEALNKTKDASPESFYYYVDLGLSSLHFKQFSDTADITLIKGRHLSSFKLALSIENVKNDLLFSGGETAGVNLYKEYSDVESISDYGIRLERKSDNRVTVAATANAIGDSFIEENSSEKYETTVTIPADTMDITLIKPGMVVGFSGFGTFADNLLLRVVRLNYTPDQITVSLGVLPKRFNIEIERITRGLLAEQTVNNPSSPS